MSARWALAAAFMFGIGCASEIEAPEGPDAEEVETDGLGPLDALSRRFGRLRSRMRERGYEERRTIGRLFALEGDGVAVPLDLPTGACTTHVALAGGGMRDLRMTLYDAEGAVAAASSVSGEGGLVHVCPQAGPGVPRTLPFYLVFEATHGSGAIVAAAFSAAHAPREGFEGLFDGVLAPHVAFREVETRLAESRAVLRERGFQPLGDPHLERVAEGEVLRRSYALDGGRCYVGVSRAGDGVADVDLYLFDQSGAEVARDIEGGATPHIEHCPHAAGRHTFEVRAYEGAGALGLMVLGGASGPLDADAEAVPPPEPLEVEPPAAALETSPLVPLAGVVSQLADRGFSTPIFIVRDGLISPGELRTHEVRVGRGCSVVLGAAGRESADLDLYLSSDGESLDRDTRVNPTARVAACPTQPTVLQVTVKAYGHDSRYALVLLRASRDVADLQGLRLEEAAATLLERGYQVGRSTREVFAEGGSVRRTIAVEGGRCVAIAAAGEAEVQDVDVFLRDRTGDLVASSAGPAAWATVSRCAEQDELLEYQVLVYRGAGEVAVARLEGAPEVLP